MGEKHLQEEFLGEESLGKKYMSEKYVQEEFCYHKSFWGTISFWVNLCVQSIWSKSMCKKSLWVKVSG